ncbi:hypothetical protein HPNQ4099_0179 [Helicobacter pylori NQ4099]|uniref:Uncharacterized protein n=2 Tax=Helicobacter pylori TaxID=210 RepID=I9Z6N7_HELPX|nr:hypothetical protein HPNQ4200_1640 [Helicobacter pylori NQ4200]EJB31783.1 hypothetical protein HPNQ4099_0179 [Helicobacter pylori NQ4099]
MWGENLELLGFLVVVGGYRDKAIIISIKKGLSVLSLCFIVLVMVLFKLALSMSD